MIDTFTKSQFESALPANFRALGLISGEYTYRLPTRGAVEIEVRSSIGAGGVSAESGEDSIRCWLINSKTGKPLGAKLTKWTTRVPGWQDRLEKLISELIQLRNHAGDCPKCHQPLAIWTVKKSGPNTGRPFASCEKKCENIFIWLDKPSNPFFADEMTPINVSHLKDKVEDGVIRKAVQNITMEAFDFSVDGLANLGAGQAAVMMVDDGAKDESPVAESNGHFVPSRYQSDFYGELLNTQDNIVLMAGPGTGKSTTLKHSAPYLPKGKRIAALSFAKKDALVLQKHMPDWVVSSTTHALALRYTTQHYKGVKLETSRKPWMVLDEITERIQRGLKLSSADQDTALETIASSNSTINQIVSLAKNTMIEPNRAGCGLICDRYGIVTNGDSEIIYELAEMAFHRSLEMCKQMVDFDDVLYLCASGKVPVQNLDFVLGDEVQDWNRAQIMMIERMVAHGGRVCVVGDSRQSIYGFRGAATDAIDHIVQHFNAKTMPLSISYRLPQSHVDLLNAEFPGQTIYARDNAPQGHIDTIKEDSLINMVHPGDLVLCRMNAPLVKPCFELIRNGVKANIAGRDIGKGLNNLITKITRREGTGSVGQFVNALVNYSDKEVAKLISAQKSSAAMTLQDQADTIVAISDGCRSVEEIKTNVERIFSDEAQGVIFSSVHKAKGGEAENVFILQPENMPHPLAKTDEQKAQERNVKFVAMSRSKNAMYYVPGEQKGKRR